jgi:DNA-binding NtrC family response regulator
MATLQLFSREVSSPLNSAILVSGSHPQSLCDTLASQYCTAEAARSGADALARVESKRFDLVLLDPKLPDLDAEEVRRMMKLQQPDLPVFLLDFATGRLIQSEPVSDPLQQALQALQPASGNEPAGEMPLAEPESVRQPDPLVEPLPDMVGRSPVMGQVYRLSRMVARRDASVLLEGDSGTGKELVARAIHQLSTRAKLPMITVNCAAIPESLLESELFGYVRGAFTGAVQSKLGRIHAAHGGTLFLDEIGELPLSMQAKLLRFLQEGEVQRLGSPDVFRVDVRVITATNADLKERIKRAEFRQDLYYRLSVFPIHIPTLHERNDDVIFLATHFLAHFCRQAKMPQKTLHTSVRSLLMQHAWPGNVRELQHAIERAFILADEEPMVRPEHFLLQ